ncbi:MAG: glycosyltransferase family 4 protein [Bacteroidetes bacterium]|nr:glycosyltransferase family 4 protein [Bacteroidota bacterium]
MHLLLDAVVFEFPPTGIAKVTAGLAAACLAQDPELSITALHRRPLAQGFPSPIRSKSFGRHLPYRMWRPLAFRAATKKIPVAWFPWNGDVPALPPHVTVVSIIHDVLPLILPDHFPSPELETAYRQRVQRDIDRTHLLFTDSDYSRQQLLAHFRIQREPHVLRFGPTLHAPTRHATPMGTFASPYFLYVGGYDKRKGIEHLLRAFLAAHKDQRISSRLILTGSKHHVSDDVRALIDSGTAMHLVEETGYVNEETLSNLYHDALALVYPSAYEGFGLPPLEAMAAGCPVITTRGTSLPEVCGDAALYVAPEDLATFSDALATVEHDVQIREELRQKGLRQAATFTWEAAATQFLGPLRAVVRQRNLA